VSTEREQLVAELLTEAIRGHRGGIGVLVRDIPHLAPAPIATTLRELAEEGISLRLAYLLPEAEGVLHAAGFERAHVSTEVEQAERWRNERALDALIVVVATGTEDKISSLEDFRAVVSSDLKSLLARRAQGGFASENEVQGRWWALLEEDPSISFGQLADYYLALVGLDRSEAVTQASRQIHRLGLLPDPALFDSPSESALRKRLQLNRELVQRLQSFTDKDRKTATRNLTSVQDPTEREHLHQALHQLKQLRRGGADLAALSVRGAQSLIDVRKPAKKKESKDGGPGGGEEKEREDLSTFVASALLDEPEAREGLDEVVQGVTDRLNQIPDAHLRPEPVSVSSTAGSDVTAEARGDVINLMAKLIGPDAYGALLEGGEGDIDAMIRQFHAKPRFLKHWTRTEIEPLLAAVEEIGEALVVELFREYDRKRTEALSLSRLLCVDPLAAAIAPSTRLKLEGVVDSYQALLKGLSSAYPKLSEELGPDAQDLISQILLLDTVVFRRPNDELTAVVAPTHPLYLWHYAEYARVVEEQRNQLSARDRELVVDAAKRLPYFLTSLCVPPIATGVTRSLTYVGRLGPLPVYGQTVRDSTGMDGEQLIRRVLRNFVDVHPTSRQGLRLAVINAPDPGAVLSLCCDLQAEGVLKGAHIVSVHQARDGARAKQVHLRSDEEDRVAQLFRAAAPWRPFTYQTVSISPDTLQLPAHVQPHVVVAFDQSEGTPSRVTPATHPIQPLAVTHRLNYRHRVKMLELTPAPGGIFAAYNHVVGIVDTGAQVSYFSMHQEAKLRERLEGAAAQATWYVVADRNVDRDLSIGSLRVFTGREGGRDIAVFSQRTDAFRRVLREVARQYNTVISDAELDDLLHELADLLDEGILALRPDASGRVNLQRVKGLIGMLIAVRAYRAQTPEGHDRLVVSLDGTEARRWLHLSDDPHRADLVGFDFSDDRFAISIIEAKAVQDPKAEYKIHDKIISGPAVDQVLSTRRLLAEVFSGDRAAELITTPARREILREHAFRELTKAIYTPEQRKTWAERLERLFEGLAAAHLHCEIMEVYLGRDAASLGQRSLHAEEDGLEFPVPVLLTQLNESGVDALRQRAAPVKLEDVIEGEPLTSAGNPTETGPLHSDEEDRAVVSVSPENVTSTPTAAHPPQVGAVSPAVPLADPVMSAASTSPEAFRARAYLGDTPGTYGKPREVWFDPQLPGRNLPNPHLLITGETGSGKTQATKAILRDLMTQGLPALILDFKDDYSQPGYAAAEGLTVYDATLGGLAFDPMVPQVDQQSGRVMLLNHVHQFGEIIKRIYKLGDQQTHRFRDALKELYTGAGLSIQPFVPSKDVEYPAFDELKVILERRKDNEPLLGRLSPIFDLGLFASNTGGGGFAEIATQSAAIRLSQLPGDETKNAVAEFFLMALYNYLVRQPHPHALRRVLVLDEAWRLVQSPFLEPLMREGRAFGLGVVIATQFPTDLPNHVSGSTATKLYFSQTKSENIREVQRSIVGKTSGAEADHISAGIRELPPLTCFVQNGQYQPYARTSVKPYFERVAAEGAQH
jgi:hypothetical protein